MSQKDRVLEHLRSSVPDGFCSLMFYAVHLPNGRNRICELRDGDGVDIETVECSLHKWHPGERTPEGGPLPEHVRYILHIVPRPARQMSLGITREEEPSERGARVLV